MHGFSCSNGAVSGAGAACLLEIIKAEIRVAMALSGVARIKEIDAQLLAPRA